MSSLFTDPNTRIFYGVQTFNSVASTVCGVSIHSYILYKMLKRNTSLSQYQDLIVLQSIFGLLSIRFAIVTVDAGTSLFFPFIVFHPILQKAILFLVSTSESIEEFLIIAFNIHRVLIFLRPLWIKKFYICFTPLATCYATCYGVLMARASERQLLETLMDILLVPVIIVSVVCYVLITRYFRSVSGYTERVKQMQTRLSTSIYLQGAIHCVLAVAALVIPLSFLATEITDGEGVMFRLALFYTLLVQIMLRWYSAVMGALMLWSVRGFFQQQNVGCIEKKLRLKQICT
ncbi:hypothetical protein Aduo_009653 [Ancylostoma duodenale]